MKLPPNLDLGQIIEACERYARTLDNPGFCLACGLETDGCEPDATKYRCDSCGAFEVYGAEELLIIFA